MANVEGVPPDPIEELTYDHREVEKLFMQFEQVEEADRRAVLDEIVKELTIHAKVEEKAVYPVMRTALANGDEKVEEAISEHQEMKELLADLKRGDPNDEEMRKKVFALMTTMRHHVEEEENDLFTELREALGPAALTEVATNVQAAKKSA